MFLLTREILTKIDPEEANKQLENNMFGSQRPLRLYHVNMLSREMENGYFLTGDIAIANCNGHKYLVNGQHTLHAVKKSGKAIRVKISEYECESVADVSSLFRRFDNNLCRSLADVSVAEANALGIEWKKRVVQLVVTAASMRNQLNGKSGVKNRKAELLKDYEKHGDFLASLLEPWKVSKHLMRGAVVDAIFRTYEKDEADAWYFWERVKTGERLDSTDPEYLLREFLIATRSRLSSIRRGDREVLYKCIYAWNSFRDGKLCKVLKYSSSYAIPAAK